MCLHLTRLEQIYRAACLWANIQEYRQGGGLLAEKVSIELEKVLTDHLLNLAKKGVFGPALTESDVSTVIKFLLNDVAMKGQRKIQREQRAKEKAELSEKFRKSSEILERISSAESEKIRKNLEKQMHKLGFNKPGKKARGELYILTSVDVSRHRTT